MNNSKLLLSHVPGMSLVAGARAQKAKAVAALGSLFRCLITNGRVLKNRAASWKDYFVEEAYAQPGS